MISYTTFAALLHCVQAAVGNCRPVASAQVYARRLGHRAVWPASARLRWSPGRHLCMQTWISDSVMHMPRLLHCCIVRGPLIAGTNEAP